MVDKLRCRCRFGMREAADSAGGAAWEADPDGCPAVLSPSDVAAHEAACAFEPVTCGNASRDGTSCGVQFRRGDTAAHQAACPLRVQPCRLGCSTQLPQCDQAKHEADECPCAMVHCSYFGCGATYRRSDTQRHDAESMADHLAGENRARVTYAHASGVEDRTLKANKVAAIMTLLQNSGETSFEDVACGLCTLAQYLPLAPKQLIADAFIAVPTAMRAHSAHAVVQRAGLACLEFLAGRAVLPQLGDAMAAAAPPAVSALLAAMNAYPADLVVQSMACAVLTTGSVLRSGAANNTLFMPSLAAGSCTPALLAALQTHSGATRLQATGLRALALALSRPAGTSADELKTRVAAAEIAIAALRRHESDIGVVQHAFAVLRACNGAAPSLARNKDAPRVVLEAADLHIAHETLVVNALDSLIMLFKDGFFREPCALAFIGRPDAFGPASYDGMRLLLRVLDERGIPRPAVTCACLRAIVEVTSNPANAINMAARCREELILTVIDVHCMRCCKEAAKIAALVLMHLVHKLRAQNISGPLVDAMAAGLVTTVSNAPELCSPGFLICICLLFAHLGSVAAHRRRLVAARALGAVVAGMRKFGSEPLVQRAGCQALVAMCPREQPHNVALAIAAGARAVVDAAAAAFPETTHSDVAKAAAAALEMLKHAPGPAPAAGAAGS